MRKLVRVKKIRKGTTLKFSFFIQLSRLILISE